MHEACKSLRAIRDARLYRDGYGTFEEYCRRRWGIARSTAYQRVDYAETHQVLSATADKVEITERQARALSGLSPEQKLRVWQTAIERPEGGRLTHKVLRQIRRGLGLDAQESPPHAPEPGQGTYEAPAAFPASVAVFDQTTIWFQLRETIEQEYRKWPLEGRAGLLENLGLFVLELKEQLRRERRHPC